MTENKIAELEATINNMAENALRTLCLAHRHFKSINELPANYAEVPPDDSALVLDCIVGIIDPLRSDVVEAVRTAQQAGVVVRMVTGKKLIFHLIL